MEQWIIQNIAGGSVIVNGVSLEPDETRAVHAHLARRLLAERPDALALVEGGPLPADGSEVTVIIEASDIPPGELITGFIDEPALELRELAPGETLASDEAVATDLAALDPAAGETLAELIPPPSITSPTKPRRSR